MDTAYLSTLDRRGGRFNLSKPKTYIEQHVYDKQDLPTPGRGQPHNGFSTLDDRGGRFNMSQPKTYIEQHVYDKRDMPTPGRGQPDFGFDTITHNSHNKVYRVQQDLASFMLGR